MAIAGLHNLSAFGPNIFAESVSQVTRQWGDEPVTPNTRASSLLQMWRELEGDNVVSPSHRSRRPRNGSDSDGLSTSENADETENQVDDNNSIISEQSTDLGETERGRVRHIFREWMNSGGTCHSSNGCNLNNQSGPQWLGENECERVRIIREWVQMNAQERTNQGSLEWGSQIEQVRDGLVVTHPEIGTRRPIRRICGRQTLLDLITRAQCERKEELQRLLEHRRVSEFAHRNRIQALLRGRFLRNESSIPEKKPSSMAASELGLLRQRNTVSGLREELLSKLDNSASASTVNTTEPDSSSNNENNDELDSENASNVTASREEVEIPVIEVETPVSYNARNLQEVSSSTEEPVLGSEATEQEEINDTITDETPLEMEDVNDAGALEVFNEHYELRMDASSAHELARDRMTNLEGNNSEQSEWQDASAQAGEFQESDNETGDSVSEQLVVSYGELIDNQWFQNTSDNDALAQDQTQESHEDDLQEAIDNWLDMPTADVGASSEGAHTFYFSDDDNAQSMELRELFSRRRVSSLLRSGFRESLNQVLQSHAERLGQASGDWEQDNATFSPILVEQETGRQNDDRALPLSEADPFAPTSTLVDASEPLWDLELQSADVLYNSSNQHLGTEWEVVNELRIDMARLQQRLNNMQSTLEQCMDMQIELQRAVRQEVSAALNRSIITRVASKGNTHHDDESQWDYVRRGICCVCCDCKIDSLLYRCGHMCTCSNCAERLVQGTGKCPMCRAPIVEAVRAYFIQ